MTAFAGYHMAARISHTDFSHRAASSRGRPPAACVLNLRLERANYMHHTSAESRCTGEKKNKELKKHNSGLAWKFGSGAGLRIRDAGREFGCGGLRGPDALPPPPPQPRRLAGQAHPVAAGHASCGAPARRPAAGVLRAGGRASPGPKSWRAPLGQGSCRGGAQQFCTIF